MIDISSTGLEALLTASVTFPNGFKIDQWADDADSIDAPDIDLGDTGMGPNGDLVKWQKPQGIPVGLNVIPSSPDDTNLDILGEANRVARGKISARDNIQIVFTFPKLIVTMSQGIIVSAPPMFNATAAGRMKSRQYRFIFEQITKVRR